MYRKQKSFEPDGKAHDGSLSREEFFGGVVLFHRMTAGKIIEILKKKGILKEKEQVTLRRLQNQDDLYGLLFAAAAPFGCRAG
jgi:hypothetical protein